MGAASGNDACIANVIRMSMRYANLATLEDGYGINPVSYTHLHVCHRRFRHCQHRIENGDGALHYFAYQSGRRDCGYCLESVHLVEGNPFLFFAHAYRRLSLIHIFTVYVDTHRTEFVTPKFISILSASFLFEEDRTGGG